MLTRYFVLTAAISSTLLFSIRDVTAQMGGSQLTTMKQAQHPPTNLDSEMEGHQAEMKALIAELNISFEAINQARDSKGYVHDNAVLKVHAANIKALRDSVRDHKIFLSDYEHKCGVNSKQQDGMIQHQQQMKGLLYDVVESFDTFEQTNDQPNNPDINIIMYIGEAFVAHRAALKELTSAIPQHQMAMIELMEKCPQIH